MSGTIVKSIIHNLGVIIVGFGVGFLGTIVDRIFNFNNIESSLSFYIGLIFLCIGFLLRVWATYYFYKHHMKVILLKPQHKLITSGPFRYSRNPLYLGGNVFIFYGASLLLSSIGALIITTFGIFVTDLMIRREEKQLEQKFGEEWLEYKKRVRRWI
jgi:protein-S-isoprenylcysteine O-methyltransferase Ste14